MNCSRWILVSLFTLFLSSRGFAQVQQQPIPQSPTSHKYRVILTPAGAAGGFAVGLFAGLTKFDDAPYAERKVWTTAIAGAAAGGVGGYFLGRLFDKRRDRHSQLHQQHNARSVRAGELHQALERSLIKRELGSRRSGFDLGRVAENHHTSALEVLVLGPLG